MKTRNNIQKKVNGQVKKMVVRGYAVIFSLVLLSWTVSGQDFWEQFVANNNFDSLAFLKIEQPIENKVEAIEAGLSLQVETLSKNCKYDASDFAEAELANETESWLNGNSVDIEMIEASLSFQAETLINTCKYDASDFAEAEIARETESWLNGDPENNEVIEAVPAIQVEALINTCKYDAGKFVKAEIEQENNVQMINEEFFRAEESQTAREAELEVVKYAQKQILLNEKKVGKQNLNQQETNADVAEPKLDIESWMDDENGFISSEQFVSKRTFQANEKYTQIPAGHQGKFKE